MPADRRRRIHPTRSLGVRGPRLTWPWPRSSPCWVRDLAHHLLQDGLFRAPRRACVIGTWLYLPDRFSACPGAWVYRGRNGSAWAFFFLTSAFPTALCLGVRWAWAWSMHPCNRCIILPLLLLLVFLLIDVDVDDLVHTILFGFLVSLSRCHTGASVLSPGGLEGRSASGWVTGESWASLGVVRSVPASGIRARHTRSVCAVLTSVQVECALCVVFLSLHCFIGLPCSSFLFCCTRLLHLPYRIRVACRSIDSINNT